MLEKRQLGRRRRNSVTWGVGCSSLIFDTSWLILGCASLSWGLPHEGWCLILRLLLGYWRVRWRQYLGETFKNFCPYEVPIKSHASSDSLCRHHSSGHFLKHCWAYASGPSRCSWVRGYGRWSIIVSGGMAASRAPTSCLGPGGAHLWQHCLKSVRLSLTWLS